MSPRLAMALVLLAGCGSEVDVPSSDAGATTGGGGEIYAFDFAVYRIDTSSPGQKGSPVAGAWVAVDLPSGERENLTTGNDGRVLITAPVGAEFVTWTVAKPGFYPVTTFYRASFDHVRAQIAEDGELYALVEELPVPERPETVEIHIDWPCSACVSVGLHTWCNPTEVGPESVEKRSHPFVVSWFSRDVDDRPLERGEVTLPDTLTDQSIGLVFDGSDSTEAETFDMSFEIPTDPESRLATEGVFVAAGMPVAVNDHSIDRTRGMAFDQRGDIGSGVLDVTVGYFPKAGEELDVEVRIYPALGGSHERWTNAMSGRSFPGMPMGGTHRMLDIPRLASPTDEPTRASRFAWQDVEGAQMYELHVQKYWSNVLGVRTLWLVASWENQEITLPELPAGYDAPEQWGSLTGGEYRVAACERWLPWAYRRLWYAPRAAAEVGCSYSEAADGPID